VEFDKVLQTSADESIPCPNPADKTSNKSNHLYKKWWNVEFEEATKARKQKTKIFLSLGNA
jgi:hypothetical protein